MNLFIGCASSNDIDNKYFESCKEYLEGLFESNNNLVFGAYNSGIMGLAYEIALNNKRKIIGSCPIVFKDDLLNLHCTKEIVTNNILERTNSLISESDALIFLPGGIGTVLELMAAIDGKRNGEFNKPIIIYNCYNFFDIWKDFLEKIYNENFSNINVKDCYYFSNNSKDTLDYINKYYKKSN